MSVDGIDEGSVVIDPIDEGGITEDPLSPPFEGPFEGVLRIPYDFETDGGNAGTIGSIGSITTFLPANAVITRSYYEVIEPLVASNIVPCSVSLGISGDDPAGIVALTDISDISGTWQVGFRDGRQTGRADVFSHKTTAQRGIEMVIAGSDVASGKFVLAVEYFVSE